MSLGNTVQGSGSFSGPVTISATPAIISYNNSFSTIWGSMGSQSSSYCPSGYFGGPEFLFGGIDYSPLLSSLTNDINTVYHIDSVEAWGPFDYTALNGKSFKFLTSTYSNYGVFEIDPSSSFITTLNSISSGTVNLWLNAKNIAIKWN